MVRAKASKYLGVLYVC